MRGLLLTVWCWLALVGASVAEKLPPKPANYFNDYAGVVSAPTARRLNEELRKFEQDTSNQIVVAIFPRAETESSIQDYTFRVADAWKVGQAGRDNGAVLFVFTQQRTMFIQVGYGLEGALPDITAKQIIENEIKPAFRAGNFDAGLTAGVTAMMQATRGEYKGTGTVRKSQGKGSFAPLILIGIVFFFFILQAAAGYRRGVVYSGRGRSVGRGFFWDVLLGMLLSSGGGRRNGGGWSGGGGDWGGGGGGGGGGFSGGGGSFGGGGAGGDW